MKKIYAYLLSTCVFVAAPAFAGPSVSVGSGSGNTALSGSFGNANYSWSNSGTNVVTEHWGDTHSVHSGSSGSSFSGRGWSNSSTTSTNWGPSSMSLGGATSVNGSGFSFVNRNPGSDSRVSVAAAGNTSYNGYSLANGSRTATWGKGFNRTVNKGDTWTSNGHGNGTSSTDGLSRTFSRGYAEGPVASTEAGSTASSGGTATAHRHY